ncbi:MAG: hypothetical protein ACM3SY_14960 [Candidatus Omnitrophota bacterium]
MRIKFENGKNVIEVEGSFEEVNKIFQEIKDLLNKSFDSSSSEELEESSEKINTNAIPEIPPQFEHLRDIASRQLPGPEIEWVLIYAFYASNFAKDLFTRDTILLKYDESNRTSSSRISNLSNNLTTLIKNRWINRFNDTEYEITEIGKKRVNEILTRQNPGKIRIVGKRKKGEKENEKGEEN